MQHLNFLFYSLALFSILLISCEKDGTKPKPIASFTISKTSAEVDETIIFRNTSKNAISYSWSFGDGNISSDENPTHAYSTVGNFLITLTAFREGNDNSSSKSITICYPAPVASFTVDKSIAKTGETITFTNTSQNATSYSWDFGDGNTSTEVNPVHQYSSSGIKTAKLTAINDTGNTTTSKEIFIKKFTIMTYNIAFSGGAVTELYEMWNNDGHGAWTHDRRSELLKIIRSVNPDILGLQEAYCWDSYNPSVYKSFADSLGMEYYYYPESDKAEWNGICIYSKYPIISTDFLLHQPCVRNQIWNGTYMVKVQMNIDNKDILDVLVCHLMFQVAGAQDCEVSTLTKYLKANYTANTILMGDMNFVGGGNYYNSLKSTNLYYLNSQIGINQATQVDQIWVSKRLLYQSRIYDLNNLSEIFDPLTRVLLTNASDHLPVVAHFGFEEF